MTEYFDLPEVKAHFANHTRKRNAAEIEVCRVAPLRWNWRFYYGRYREGPGIVAWRDYEQGTALTQSGAKRAARRQMRRLHASDNWVVAS